MLMRMESSAASATPPSRYAGRDDECTVALAKEVARAEGHCAIYCAIHEGRRQGHTIRKDDRPPSGGSDRRQADEEADASRQGHRLGISEEDEEVFHTDAFSTTGECRVFSSISDQPFGSCAATYGRRSRRRG